MNDVWGTRTKRQCVVQVKQINRKAGSKGKSHQEANISTGTDGLQDQRQTEGYNIY